jgi:hypothetical protein
MLVYAPPTISAPAAAGRSAWRTDDAAEGRARVSVIDVQTRRQATWTFVKRFVRLIRGRASQLINVEFYQFPNGQKYASCVKPNSARSGWRALD